MIEANYIEGFNPNDYYSFPHRLNLGMNMSQDILNNIDKYLNGDQSVYTDFCDTIHAGFGLDKTSDTAKLTEYLFEQLIYLRLYELEEVRVYNICAPLALSAYSLDMDNLSAINIWPQFTDDIVMFYIALEKRRLACVELDTHTHMLLHNIVVTASSTDDEDFMQIYARGVVRNTGVDKNIVLSARLVTDTWAIPWGSNVSLAELSRQPIRANLLRSMTDEQCAVFRMMVFNLLFIVSRLRESKDARLCRNVGTDRYSHIVSELGHGTSVSGDDDFSITTGRMMLKYGEVTVDPVWVRPLACGNIANTSHAESN